MSKEKQIEEIIEVLNSESIRWGCGDMTDNDIAEALYNAGCRKQSKGEWEQQLRPYEDEIKCTACGALFNVIDNCTEKFNYCPNCGAKMKGGEE